MKLHFLDLDSEFIKDGEGSRSQWLDLNKIAVLSTLGYLEMPLVFRDITTHQVVASPRHINPVTYDYYDENQLFVDGGSGSAEFTITLDSGFQIRYTHRSPMLPHLAQDHSEKQMLKRHDLDVLNSNALAFEPMKQFKQAWLDLLNAWSDGQADQLMVMAKLAEKEEMIRSMLNGKI